MEDEIDTLNKVGGCMKCGSKKFTVLEEIVSYFTLDPDSGVLIQDDGPMHRAEVIDAQCIDCGVVYEVEKIGELKFKPIGV